jgi:hypothetical protein
MLKPGGLKKFKPVGGSATKFKTPGGSSGSSGAGSSRGSTGGILCTPSSTLKSSSAARPLSVASDAKNADSPDDENAAPGSALRTPQVNFDSRQQGPLKPKPLVPHVPKTPSQPILQDCAEDDTPQLTEAEKDRKKANMRAVSAHFNARIQRLLLTHSFTIQFERRYA